MYMRRRSVVRAKNTRNKHVFAQVKPIYYDLLCNMFVQRRCITYTPILPNRSDTFMFNNNVAVPDVLETIFFKFKLIGWKLKITHLHFSASL